MNSKSALLMLALAALLSCKKADNVDESLTPAVDIVERTPTTECFMLVNSRDTITMTMNRERQSASGDLIYDWFEKDGNVGTYVGSFKGDTLRIGYTFQSEGMTSIREEIFLVRGNELVKGHGNIIEKNGKQVFENRKNVIFDRSIVLTKADCKN